MNKIEKDFAKYFAEELVEKEPEFANDLYFALDEIFVKKTPWHTELTQVVNSWVNPKPEKTYIATVEDATDGSGDAILNFPEGMCDELGWKEGDTLNFDVRDDGKIYIMKVS